MDIPSKQLTLSFAKLCVCQRAHQLQDSGHTGLFHLPLLWAVQTAWSRTWFLWLIFGSINPFPQKSIWPWKFGNTIILTRESWTNWKSDFVGGISKDGRLQGKPPHWNLRRLDLCARGGITKLCLPVATNWWEHVSSHFYDPLENLDEHTREKLLVTVVLRTYAHIQGSSLWAPSGSWGENVKKSPLGLWQRKRKMNHFEMHS